MLVEHIGYGVAAAVPDDVTAQPKPAAPRAKGRGIPHLPGLDGLRGLAVLAVIFFHADGLLPGGYLGVDLFFVLSGYLITSILLAEQRDTGRIDLAHFWVRRARRLFPALLSLMPAVALYAAVFAKPNELSALRGDALATLGYMANWRDVLSHKSYWQLFAAPSPLEHTWSLAIEEQFYVVWPLLLTLVLIVLRRGRRVMLAVTLALIGVSVAAMLHVYHPSAALGATSAAYFRTDTRAAAILAGAALAFLFPPAKDVGARLGARARVLDAVGLIALAVIVAAWLTLDGRSPFLYHGGFWLTELACVALIACAVCGRASFIARGLAFRPLAYIGTISYGLYLWHWPVDCVLTLERTHLREPWLEIARLALTFGIAVVSYRYLERPIRSRGLTFARARFVVPSAFAGAALLVVWATVPRSLLRPGPPRRTAHTRWPTPFSVNSHTLPPASALPPGTLRVLTLGDSVAAKLGLALRYQQDHAHAFVAERGVGNCSILKSQIFLTGGARGKPNKDGGCAAHWAADVAEVKPDVTLVVLGGAYLGQIQRDGRTEWACDAGWQDAYRARLNQLLAAMGKNAGRVMLTLVPYPLGRWLQKGTADHVDCFNQLLASVAAAHSLPTVNLAKHICPTRDCVIFSQGKPIRPDGLHPDGKGAEESARWTLAQIRQRFAVDGLRRSGRTNRAGVLPALVRSRR